MAHTDFRALDRDSFGRALMKLLEPLYRSMSLKAFAERMYCLWETLPGAIGLGEPFYTLAYADEPLAWGDETQARALYEAMLSFYETEMHNRVPVWVSPRAVAFSPLFVL